MHPMIHDTQLAVPAARSSGKGRILLVDDEPVLRAMASTVLIAQGWEVMNAASAEEAAELLHYCVRHQTRIDVVVLDLILPGGMSGMEALDVLRRILPGGRFVASSSFFAGDESRTICLSLGFDDVLPKPYTVSALAETIESNMAAVAAKASAWAEEAVPTQRAA